MEAIDSQAAELPSDISSQRKKMRKQARLSVMSEGSVYIMQNPAYHENLFKIGRTARNAQQRASEIEENLKKFLGRFRKGRYITKTYHNSFSHHPLKIYYRKIRAEKGKITFVNIYISVSG
ncbi:MAG: GIY-YIG nuclease family protein [Timaviella obliquedivisa GSE-PSE-MK23-08B]|nr:GIY-YIG nuclease family protein [Timaviella obliquedivisa GSE-PSE-MK23-08B]